MSRQEYFNFIEEKLSGLAYRIEMRGGLNLLDLHLHSENFYNDLFNILFDWSLQNCNTTCQNTAGIDLIDSKNKTVLQVSATTTKQKVESTLAKLSKYADYSFKFISISKDADKLRKQKFKNPHKLKFDPSEDIYDVPGLLCIISSMPIEKLKTVYEFIKKELKNEPDPSKLESNLTTIINIISKEDWGQKTNSYENIPYEIEKKITYNQLDSARVLIEDYNIHYHRIEKIYSDFDKQGVNKSMSVLNCIRSEYLSFCKNQTPDQCFFSIIDIVKQKILSSSNYSGLPEEELELCVQILVVDAFIRCKIFKNPERL